MTISEQKKTLRKVMLEQRNQLNAITKSEYDSWICNELEQLIVNRNYSVIHIYIPFAQEINVIPLIEKLLLSNITIVCPKTLPKRALENRILKNLSDLETGIMGTQHPATCNIYKGKCDLIIVPGLAFDETNFRLGYGGGYYDNFLATQSEAFKVGVFYPFQKVANVPVEPHDIHLDLILATDF